LPEVATWRVKSLYKLATASQTTAALVQTERCVLTVNIATGESYEVSLRRAGKQHHLGIGQAHASKSVFLIIDAKNSNRHRPETGEILSEHTIESTKSDWPKNRQTN
jgi:hypothetical protein